MSYDNKPQIYLGVKQVLGLFTSERRGMVPDAKNDDQAWDLLNNSWKKGDAQYQSVRLEFDTRNRQVFEFHEVQELSHYLEVCSRRLNKNGDPINGVFTQLYESGLVRNLDEFNDLWIWVGSSRDKMEELLTDLKVVSYAYDNHIKNPVPSRVHKGRRVKKAKRKTKKVKID